MERVVRFGKTASLVGILCEPDGERAPDAPAIVMLNSGILHRAGASRLYVKFARALAGRGFTSLRFDFSGIGDSEPRRDALRFEESAIVEAREAMDHLEQSRGSRRFVLIGLCSGSDMAHAVALADERVTGIAHLDAYVYRTWKFYLTHYRPRVFNLGVWKNAIRLRLRAAGGQAAEPQPPSAVYVAPEYRRVFPPRQEVEEGLRRLIDRGVKMFHFFSGGMEEHVNHESQYTDAFPSVDFRDAVEVMYVRSADHIVTDLGHQSLVVSRIADWAERNFGSRADRPLAATG